MPVICFVPASPNLPIDMLNEVNEVLSRLTMDQLKSLMRWLPDTTPTGKKDQLVGQILKSLDGDGLRMLWDRLDDTQRMAVTEAAYTAHGVFHRKRFRAKYGRLPDFTVNEGARRYSSRGQPTALGLFLHYEDGYYRLPCDSVNGCAASCLNLRPSG